MSIDQKFFFDQIRPLFGGHFKQSQVDGMAAILFEWDGRMPNGDHRWLAYMLATTFHETARQMTPVREAYWLSEQWRKTHLPYYPYYGRGYVQLTHKANYKRAGDYLNDNLVQGPDLALKMDYAAAIMFVGMVEGWFRADSHGPHTLARYFGPGTDNPVGARAIINGYEQGVAENIADYHESFLKAIRLTKARSLPFEFDDRFPEINSEPLEALASRGVQSISTRQPSMHIMGLVANIVTSYVAKSEVKPSELPELITGLWVALSNSDRVGVREEPIVVTNDLSGPPARPKKRSEKSPVSPLEAP